MANPNLEPMIKFLAYWVDLVRFMYILSGDMFENTQPQGYPIIADAATKECLLPQLCCACACYVWGGRGKTVQSHAEQCVLFAPSTCPKRCVLNSLYFGLNRCYTLNSFCYKILQYATSRLNVDVFEFFWCGAGKVTFVVCRSSPSLRWARTKRSMPAVRVHFPSGHGAKTGEPWSAVQPCPFSDNYNSVTQTLIQVFS